MSILGAAWLIARKDLVVEARSRELAYTTLFFALAVRADLRVLLRARGTACSMARRPASSGWRSRSRARSRSAARSSASGRARRCVRCCSRPIERPAVYLGKLLGLVLLMFGVEAIVVPIVGLLFDAPLGRAPWLLAGLLVTGTIGLAAVGTLFAAMLVRAHSRDVLLPVLLYPIAVPVVIAGAVRHGRDLRRPSPISR